MTATTIDEDTGEMTCARCEAVFSPLPGFQNFGHQCHTDGTERRYQA